MNVALPDCPHFRPLRHGEVITPTMDIGFVFPTVPGRGATCPYCKLDARIAELERENLSMWEARCDAFDAQKMNSDAILRKLLGQATFDRLWGPDLESLGHVLDAMLQTIAERNKRIAELESEREYLIGVERTARKVMVTGHQPQFLIDALETPRPKIRTAICGWCGTVIEKNEAGLIVDHLRTCVARNEGMETQLRSHEATIAQLVKENEDLHGLVQRGTELMTQLEVELKEARGS